MKTMSPPSVPMLVLAVASALCFSTSPTWVRAGVAPGDTEFRYEIQPDLGASEFAPGDGIVIKSLRGDRQHLEPGGHYFVEGSYTLASAEDADLAWFCTSRGPSGSTPVTAEEHVKVGKGSGEFHLQKTLLEDGWLHLSFYVNGRSHGGIYFGEKGVEKTVLRQKGWSDFSNAAPPTSTANAAIMAYLGNPVAAPATLDPKYTPTNLLAAFTAMSAKAGWRIQKLAVDESEFPFLVFGLVAGRHELGQKEFRGMQGYEYGGSVVGITEDGSTYFALNMIPRDQYPSELAAACNRRLMVRLQMLADAIRQAP